MSTISILVCDDETKADVARDFLIHQGYEDIWIRSADFVSYDAAQFDSGAVDAPGGTWVVAGRKP